MLRLAVTTRAETFERLRDPLATREIDVVHLPVEGRTIDLTGADGGVGDVDAGLVFPSRVAEGTAVSALLDVPWVNGREAVLTSRNKGGAIAALSAAGLPVPETTLVSNPVDEAAVRAAAEAFDWPVVVKPNSTTRGRGVVRASDLDSLLGVVDYLNLVHDDPATGDKSYLLQEFLPDARDYRVMVVDGEYAGAVERRSEAGWKHNVHRGAAAESVDLPAAYRRLAERAADVLGVPFLGVDLLATGDRVVVNETNARPTVDESEKYEDGFYDRLAALIRRTAEN
ncbi:RimK family alpha-L-glutamate ligase [Haloplanus sp. GCM10025708]|uniref:ATP-grasp domain-containing protein n=1 Tax=Haloferacaceae TaxID=1644056 RepID=UPI00360ADF6A